MTLSNVVCFKKKQTSPVPLPTRADVESSCVHRAGPWAVEIAKEKPGGIVHSIKGVRLDAAVSLHS